MWKIPQMNDQLTRIQFGKAVIINIAVELWYVYGMKFPAGHFECLVVIS